MDINEELHDNLQRVYRQMLVFSDLALQREELTRTAFAAREPLEECKAHVTEKDWPGSDSEPAAFDRDAWIAANGEALIPDATGTPEFKSAIRRDVLVGVASGVVLFVLLGIFSIGETVAQRVVFAVIFALVCGVGDCAHDYLKARPRGFSQRNDEISSSNEAAADEAEKTYFADQKAERSAKALLWVRTTNDRIDYENSLVDLRNAKRVKEADERLASGDGNMIAVIDEQLAATSASYQAGDASWYPAPFCTLDACRALVASVADGSASTLEEATTAYRERIGADADLVGQATLVLELSRLDVHMDDLHDEFVSLADEYSRGRVPALGAHAGIPARVRLVGECLSKGDLALGSLADEAFWTCYGLWGTESAS